jgi:hypothetical protein
LQRRYGFNTYADPGTLVAPAADVPCAHFQPAAERFHRDFAAEERERATAATARKQAGLMQRRQAEAEREAARWAAMDAADVAERERLSALRLDGGKARKNRPGLPYDPLRNMYHGTGDGEVLR